MSSVQDRAEVPNDEPVPKGLWLGILAYRWASYVWMTSLAVVSQMSGDFRRPALAWIAIVVTGLWTVWLTVTEGWQRRLDRWIDLAICTSLILLAGVVMREGGVVGGVPFFATSYPASAALTMGAASGVWAGLGAGITLSLALYGSRPLNGVELAEMTRGRWAAIGNGAVYYLSAGGAAGLIQRALTRQAAQLRHQAAQLRLVGEAAVRERERAARLAERESIARRIHDSVLQALSLIAKRGTELAAAPRVEPAEVQTLADLAGEQQRVLRGLVQDSLLEPPDGTVALRTGLEAAAFGVREIPVDVTAVEPIWMVPSVIEEVSAAVRQALGNVVEHAQATRASVFAERDGDDVVITVRDDGVGFVYDEDRLRRDGKLGVLTSMKGRIEDLGGSMRVESTPGRGTEVEFRLPSGGSATEERA